MGISKALTKTITKAVLAAAFLAASSSDAVNSRAKNSGLIVYAGKQAYDHGPAGLINLFREFNR